MTFEQAQLSMPPDARLRATVYAMNVLLIKNGVYRHEEFATLFVEWAEREYKPVTCDVAQEIHERVCTRFGITTEELLGKRAPRSTIFARQVAMYLLRKITHLSQDSIGQMFRRHHTIVSHAEHTVESRRGTAPELDAFLTAVITSFRGTSLCVKS